MTDFFISAFPRFSQPKEAVRRLVPWKSLPQVTYSPCFFARERYADISSSECVG